MKVYFLFFLLFISLSDYAMEKPFYSRFYSMLSFFTTKKEYYEDEELSEEHKCLEKMEFSEELTPHQIELIKCLYEENNPENFRSLLIENENVDFQNGRLQNFSLLHYAVWISSLDFVKILITAYANPNIQECYGRTPLVCSLQDRFSPGNSNNLNNLKIIEYLLKNGTDVNNLGYKKQTALILAAGGRKPPIIEKSALELVQLFLEAGADCTIRDESGKTAIEYARENHFNAIVKLLSEKQKIA